MTLIALTERIAWTEQAISGPRGWRWTPRWHAWSDLESVDDGQDAPFSLLTFRTGCEIRIEPLFVAIDEVLERAKDELARRGTP